MSLCVCVHTRVSVCVCVSLSGWGLWAGKPGCVALGPVLCLSEALFLHSRKGRKPSAFPWDQIRY